jgi:ribosomal protein S18 acetylase RimI-like enzyme
MLTVQALQRFSDEIESNDEGLCALCEDEAGGAVACSVGLVRSFAGHRYACIGFVAVRKEFRRMGLGAAAIRELAAGFRARGLADIVVDMPGLPAEFALAMEARGYRSFGMRALAPPD